MRPIWLALARKSTTLIPLLLLLGLFAGGPSSGPIQWLPAAQAQQLEGDASGGATGSMGDIATAGAAIDPAIKDRIEKNSGQGFPVLANAVGQNRVAINMVWTLVCGFLVMFMQAGFALVETGFTRAKNASHTFLMNFCVYFIGLFGFWVCGFAFMFGNAGAIANLGGTPPLTGDHAIAIPHFGTILGTSGFFLAGNHYDVGVYTLFLFQMVFMDTAATIPTGAMAERWKFTSFIPFCFWVSCILYPVFGHWAWGGGWLSTLGKNFGMGSGYVDFAGSGVVHSVGGCCALAGAMVLGPRIGKYNEDGSANAIPGHNVPMALLGALILGFGWFGFNPGSTLGASGVGNLRIGIIATSTMLASAGSGVAAMAYMYIRTGKPDPTMVANGFLAGLVAITAPSAFVSGPIAVLIGAIAGILVCLAVQFFDKIQIDDPVGAISVHAVCGLFGVLCVGLFADGTYGGGINGVATAPMGLIPAIINKKTALGIGQLEAQVIGMITVAVWAFGSSFLFFKTLDAVMGIRSKPEDEIAGLDIPETGILAYPTFPSEVDLELAA